MSGGTSDLIAVLGTTVPLAGGGSLTTEKYIAGQYSTLNVLLLSDQLTTAAIQFSGDGVNWDTEVLHTFAGGVGSVTSTVIISKWVRVVYTNLGAAQTTLRAFVYASIQSTPVTETPGEGGSALAINPLTAYGSNALIIESPQSIFSFTGYHFETLPIIRTSTVGDYSKRRSGESSTWYPSWIHGDSAVDYMLLDRTTFADGIILRAFGGAAVLTVPQLVMQSTRMTCPAGLGPIMLTGTFFQPVSNFNGHRERILVGLISGYSISGASGLALQPAPMTAIGSWTDDFATLGDSYELIIEIGDGTNTIVVPQSEWNVDKADGSGELPLMSLSAQATTARIYVSLSGGYIVYQLLSPSTAQYVTVHVYKSVRLGALFTKKSFAAFISGGHWNPLVTNFNSRLELYHLELQQSATAIASAPSRLSTLSIRANPISSATQPLFAVRNRDISVQWDSNANRLSCALARVRITANNYTQNPTADRQGYLEIYQLHDSQLTQLASSWLDIDYISPLESKQPTIGVINNGTRYPPARLIASLAIPHGMQCMVASVEYNFYDGTKGTAASNEDCILPPASCLYGQIVGLPNQSVMVYVDLDFTVGV